MQTLATRHASHGKNTLIIKIRLFSNAAQDGASQLRPNPWFTFSKLILPPFARPDSATAMHPKSSYGMSRLGNTAWCEQHFVNTYKYSKFIQQRQKEDRVIVVEKSPLRPLEPTKTTTIPWSTPEEEAAHLFIYAMGSIRFLLKYGATAEFVVFGQHFDRAFIGAVDRITAMPVKEGEGKVICVYEDKSYAQGTSGIDHVAKHKAMVQASLYIFFLRQMFEVAGPFNFGAYFRTRGLDPKRMFSPAFSIQFKKKLKVHRLLLSEGSFSFRHLTEVGEYYSQFIKSLGPIQIDPTFYITEAPRPGRLSSVAGFGSLPKKPKTKSAVYNETFTLAQSGLAIDLLDGRQIPSGVSSNYRWRCSICPYHEDCKYSWTGRPLSFLDPAPAPVSQSIATTSSTSQLLRQLDNDKWKPSETRKLFPSPKPKTLQSVLSSEVKPAPRAQNVLDLLNSIKFDSPSSASTVTDRAHGPIAINDLGTSTDTLSATLSPGEHSALREELLALRETERIIKELQQEKQIIMSKLTKLRFARMMAKERIKASRKAEMQAKRIQEAQRAAQLKEYRAKIRERRAVDPGSLTTAIVPFKMPTQPLAGSSLYTPSIGMSRLRRRTAVDSSGERAKLRIPTGGRALPEDQTYSASRLKAPPKASDDSWTYQFDSLPSLESQQRAMTRSEADSVIVESISDAENEQIAREERRARRRLERQAAREQ